VTASREVFAKVVSLLEANFPTQPNFKLEKVSKLIWGASLPRPGDAPDSQWAFTPLNHFLENNFGHPTLYQRDGLYGGDSKYADPDFVPKTKRVPITLTAHWREKAWDETKEQRQKEIDATEKEFVEAVVASFGGPMTVSDEAPKKVPEDHEMTTASEEVQGERYDRRTNGGTSPFFQPSQPIINQWKLYCSCFAASTSACSPTDVA
jgi:hypothetical protein